MTTLHGRVSAKLEASCTSSVYMYMFPFSLYLVCHLLHFCKTDPSNNRSLYREVFVPGVLASFFGTFLQGNSELVSYITHRSNMPLPLGQLWFDLNCTHTHGEI